MKITWSIFGAALAALFLCRNAQAVAGGEISQDVYMPIYPAQAYSSTFSMRTDGMNWASAETLVTSATVAAGTFTDGGASTATFTVGSYAALSSATATGTQMTISSDTALVGACISGGGTGIGNFNVCNPANWAVDLVTSSNTACNIAAAIQATGVILSTCAFSSSTGIIFSTAPTYGSVWNSFGVNSSTLAALSSSTFSGGQDNQSLTVNGKKLVANTDFFPLTTNAVTATNIATAITASSVTTGVVAAAQSNGIVYATTTVSGLATNYAIASSTQAALTMSPYTSSSVVTGVALGNMAGGSNAAYVLNQSTITIAGNGFSQNLAVAFSTGSGVGISGLTELTTYFVIEIPATIGQGASFMLSASSTTTGPGAPVILSSSQTLNTADSFTLTPLVISGTPNITWVVSNDNATWLPYATTPLGQTIPSVSYGTYFSTGTSTLFDFGRMDFSYLGLSVTAPNSGGVNIKARVVGKQQ